MVPLSKKRTRKLCFVCDPPLVILYFVFLIGTVWVDGYVYPDKDLLGLYLINIIVAGIVFWRTIVLQIVIVGLLTWFYYMYAPFRFPHANVIVFQGLTHFLAILSISSAIKYYKREKENTLNLTLTLAKSLDARDKYTAALLSAVPVPDPLAKRERIVLQGDVPSPANPPQGCTFHPRCAECMDICRTKRPEWKNINGHYVACHLY